MSLPNGHDYYRARAATARELAGRAANPAIAAIHAELADRYERLAAETEPKVDSAMTDAQAT